jgi:excisionase family DNA binding protein
MEDVKDNLELTKEWKDMEITKATKNLLSIDDLCKLLNCKKSFIYSLNARKALPGKVVLGRRTIRYEEAAILNWLKSRQEVSRSE